MSNPKKVKPKRKAKKSRRTKRITTYDLAVGDDGCLELGKKHRVK